MSELSQELVRQMCPPLEEQLLGQLLSEFESMEQRYVVGDWEPATLDGGQFTEAAARILYHVDSGRLALRKSVHDCLKYIEDWDGSWTHQYPSRKSALHTSRVLRAIYKFRSDRGAVHIDPEYTANHLDARFVIEAARWTLGEILRIFWSGDRRVIARHIRELVRYDTPAVADFDGRLLVQRTNLSVEQEILLLLHHVGDNGLQRTELGTHVHRNSSTVTKALKRLADSHKREILRRSDGQYVLTELGASRVREELLSRLTD